MTSFDDSPELPGSLLETLREEPSPRRSIAAGGGPGPVEAPAPASGPAPSALSSELPCGLLGAGTVVGRYVVARELGQGAMGVVYEAFDPELQRRVALKLMHVQGPGGPMESGARTRLLREAQALARVSHPNVIAAYDVGCFRGSVFIAMEFVEGQTLRDWLDAAPRNQAQIVDAFLQAAAGLAAAHRVGLIHRDFKPENVMIDVEGRVHVLDFGLAREANVRPEVRETLLRGRQVGNSDQLRAQLTATGTIMGTPAYMAPEQHLGELSDARTDQFGFCVALYESLYGERPFGGETYASISLEVLDGNIRQAPKGAGGCQYRKALLRGLARERADRYASMEELIKRLRRVRGARRRRLAGLAVAVGFLVAAAAGSAVMAQRAPCRGAADRLTGVWDGAVRARIERAFAETKRPYAADTFQRVSRTLDQYASAWVDANEGVCEATQVKGTQSAALMDRKMYCLDERLRELKALTTLLAEQADGAVVDRSLRIAMELSPVERCQDLGVPSAKTPLPADPKQQSAINGVRARLAEAGTLQQAGKYREALEQVRALAPAADALGFAPVRAEFELSLGRLERETGELKASEAHLRKAAAAAAEAQDALLVPASWIEVARTIGIGQGRHDEGLLVLGYAEMALQDERQRADLYSTRGEIQVAQGRYDEARASHEKALALREKLLGSEHPLVAVSRSSLGELARQQGRYEDALRYHEQAVAGLEQSLGPEHPEVASALDYLAGATFALGDNDKAMALLERSLGIKERSLGLEHLELATTLNIMGHVFMAKGDLTRAREAYTRVLTIRKRSLGPDHPSLATPINNLGNVAEIAGELPAARRYFLEALRLKEKAYGESHPLVVIPLNNLGNTALHQGDLAAAKTYFDKALAVGRATLDEQHTHVAFAKAGLGMVLFAQGRCDKAIPLLEQALGARLALGEDGVWMAEAKGTLAACLWRRGRRPQAILQYREAVAILNDAGSGADAAARARFQSRWDARTRR